jgi:diaminopimelate epimerase
MKLEFWKYEGAGNDFVLLDQRGANFEPTARQIHFLCDRRRGIGADGLMMLGESQCADFSMRYFNADGPEATMCGNGGRCITWFADLLGIGGDTKQFEAVDGLHTATILRRGGGEAVVRLGMSDVESVTLCPDGDVLLDTGSPHLVRRVESLDMDVVGVGRALRYDAKTTPTGGANINFVEVRGEGDLALRTYERGVEDETLACGTGATATAIAVCHTLQPTVHRFRLQAQGGLLEVEFTPRGEGRYTDIFLTGPARLAFHGTIELPEME